MMTSELISFAAEQQRCFDASTSPKDRKERGHFGTPPAIAKFMAEMFTGIKRRSIRIVDPGAGVGTLSAAMCQRVMKLKSPRILFFELWENDPRLIPILRDTMIRCQTLLRNNGHQMEFEVREDDFILSHCRKTLFDTQIEASFNLAILNPPYFKLRKESPHAKAMQHIVHGQPNIYALFMAAAADLLLPGGEMVAITPRSYFSGPYFKRFRKWFFDRLVARHIHVFESRKEAFKDDAVLQENVILRAEKGGVPTSITLTTSMGRDNFSANESSIVAYDTVIDNSDGDNVIRVTTNDLEHKIVAAMDKLPHRFRSLGFEISTGPVVTFRSTEFLREEKSKNTAPLLWMHNVRPFVTQWPPKNGKPTHIEVSKQSMKLLVPAKTYILLKRFTSKEEKRRLVAGIFNANDSYSNWVGLENHLNYVYRRDSEISDSEALGLAAFFNSALVDRYFRAISGNTQVNATEIRGMPIPDQITLMKIGEEVRECELDATTVENIVGRKIRLSQDLIDQLIEASK